MNNLPPFTSPGEDAAIFYSLAYCVGHYGRGTPPPPVCLSLDFCPSPGFCRFSFQVRAADGQPHHYHRGDDALDTLEYALIFASVTYRTPPNYWQLFPVPGGAATTWESRPADRDAYFEARTHLSRILYRLRAHNQPKLRPLFLLDMGAAPPGLFDGAPDAEEIAAAEFKAVAEVSLRNDRSA